MNFFDKVTDLIFAAVLMGGGIGAFTLGAYWLQTKVLSN